MRRFVLGAKDYVCRPMEDIAVNHPGKTFPPFDYRTLGRYDPARSDCPGDVPDMPISDVAEDDPEYGQTTPSMARQPKAGTRRWTRTRMR